MRGAGGTVDRRLMAIVAVAALCFPPVAEAQVGLSSGPAQVTLVARRSAQGSLGTVGTTRELSRRGSVREALTTVRLTANARYRLVVRRSPGTAARVWVRSIDGEFHEVTRDTPVTVDRGRGGVEQERQVHIRVDGPDHSRGPLPVFYDLVLSPAL